VYDYRGAALQTHSHGVLAGPLAGGGLVLGAVALEDIGDVGHERVVGVSISEQGADGEQHLRDGECGAPLVLEDVQANATIAVDVGVVYFSDELNLWGLERVVRGEVDVQEEHTTGEGRVVGAHDSGLPMEVVSIRLGSSGTVGRWVFAEVY
jgi:hypothetical protein